MRRVALLVAAMGVVALVGPARPASRISPAPPSLTAASNNLLLARSAPRFVLALVARDGVHSRLTRLDPLSLRPRAGPRVWLGLYDLPWSFSPDRSRLALGSGRTSGVIFVDVKRMRSLGIVRIGGLSALSWLAPRRVALLTGGQAGSALVIVDPVTRRIVTRTPLTAQLADGTLAAAQTVGDRLIVLAQPADTIGPTRLVVADASGSVRSVELSQVPGGWVPPQEGASRPIVRFRTPALAVDPAGSKAIAFSATSPVAEVDLATLAVRYHAPSEQVALLGRLHDWLEPPAAADGGLGEGSERRAVWLRGTLVAITGRDQTIVTNSQGQPDQAEAPAGLKLLDTSSWTLRTVSTKASSFTYTHGLLIASEGSSDPESAGLVAYGPDGTRRFRLPQRPYGFQTAGRYGYLGAAGEYRRHRVAVVDLDTGRIVRRPAVPGWTYILDPAQRQSCWC